MLARLLLIFPIMLPSASGQVPTYSVAGPNDSPSMVVFDGDRNVEWIPKIQHHCTYTLCTTSRTVKQQFDRPTVSVTRPASVKRRNWQISTAIVLSAPSLWETRRAQGATRLTIIG
jgi:hypothetical protein